ncbi:TIGR02679 family protein [Actinomadura sp. CNU-125]|uniref:TIGR02679 family protein n=1 Tax=Actinomadura sp. CNU-125 TaxID=1904961 RepID=UPI000AFA3BB1|nr:TIGR02679 family protein [Actinomadura sp. CNU-125]
MSALPAAARDWLGGPGLARLWDRTRERLERNGLQATGALRLTGLDLRERTELAQLLGRPVTGGAVTVRLADLDARLRSSAVGGSASPRPWPRSAAAHRPPRRPGGRAGAARTDVVGARGGRGGRRARRGGVGPRLDGRAAPRHVPRGVAPEAAARTLGQAVDVLAVLFDAAGPGTRSRGELATEATGSAHGLDDGTWLARLVQRGIALAHGVELPEDAAGRRALWRAASVVPDEISGTVLAYGLRPDGDGWRARALRERAAHHAESHLTLRDLRALRPSVPAGTLVHICENPRVVEAAADAGCARPLVCTSGSASTVVLTLLDALADAGCRFAYHGDFDWPGVALANRIVDRYAARPWRLRADDYEALAARARDRGVPPLPLAGRPVEAVWDPGLSPAMAALGVALHEEATVDLLVEDLA